MCRALFVFYVHTHTHTHTRIGSPLETSSPMPQETQLVSLESGRQRESEREITAQRRRICSLKRICALSQREREHTAHGEFMPDALTHLPRVVFMNETDYNEWRPALPATLPTPSLLPVLLLLLPAACCRLSCGLAKTKFVFAFVLLKKLLFLLSLSRAHARFGSRLLCYFI